jgi:hypothetical protein
MCVSYVIILTLNIWSSNWCMGTVSGDSAQIVCKVSSRISSDSLMALGIPWQFF